MSTTKSVAHATFVLERTYRVSPHRVFRAFSDLELKTRWFAAPDDWEKLRHEMDFEVGGYEVNEGRAKDGHVHLFEGVYRDIVPDQRIVYAYDMSLDGELISVSLTTIELEPAGDGTTLRLTEQGAFLDGVEGPEKRRFGTVELLESLGRELTRQGASA